MTDRLVWAAMSATIIVLVALAFYVSVILDQPLLGVVLTSFAALCVYGLAEMTT